ncbi:MAG TPA: DNA polymerase III subunit delta [Nitrospinota bacterium]|nr:DNA polymerase III subunit delta [Nitrospinota bacterium]|tara:strand:- start:102931 stop:103989 length:1059 start_codon:yes stop_codon:yes gene_type:complete
MTTFSTGAFKGAIKNIAETGEFSPVYFIYGPEERRVKDAALLLKNALLPHFGGVENYFRYQQIGSSPPEETEFSDVIAQLNTMSIFGGKKLVWVGPLKSIDNKLGNRMAEYCQNPNSNSVLLILLSPGKGDNRTLAAFERSEFSRPLLEFAQSIKLAKLTGQGLTNWLTTRFRTLDKSIDQDAAKALIELCSDDIDRLDGEVVKLACYVGDSKMVTTDDVESTVGDNKTEKIWDLTRAFGQKDLSAAQLTLASLLDSGVPAQVILKTITIELNRLAAAVEAKKMRLGQESFANKLGEPPFMVREAWANEKNWTTRQTKHALAIVLETSVTIMKSSMAPEIALNSLLVKALLR